MQKINDGQNVKMLKTEFNRVRLGHTEVKTKGNLCPYIHGFMGLVVHGFD